VVRERGRQTISRAQLERRHGRLAHVSPEVGRLDQAAFAELLSSDPDAAIALVADLAQATDPQLRAQARKLAARLFVKAGRLGQSTTRGYRRLTPDRRGTEGDLDLDLSLEVSQGRRPTHADELVTRSWSAPRRALCLLIDHSGSMQGHAVGLAAMAAAAVVLTRTERASTSIVAFAADALVLQAQSEIRRPETVVDELLSLRGKGRTDLALALRTAAAQLNREPASERLAVLLSDCRATAGDDPLAALGRLDRVHVLGTSDAPDSVAAGRALAARARGRYVSATRFSELQTGLLSILV
jgi:Mg-chelatase subunit ChlD